MWNGSESPLHTDDLEPVTRLWTESLTTGKGLEINLRLRRKADDKYHRFLSRATPVRNEQGAITRWIGTLTDVHSDRLVLSQLQIERDMRERFVAALSHDLRSPMASARMSAQLLQRNADKPDFLEKYSQKIIKSIDRADDMIRDLLDANRISAGEGLPITVGRCDLGLIALEVVEELRAAHGDRFTLQVLNECKGEWSRSGVRRILENLLSNGLKYGDEKFPVTISLSKTEQIVVIEVHNLGTPIPLADQTTIFEQYRRLAIADESAHKGWGLGLTLVKGIAEAHGGHVSVKSNREAGTTFTVTLPE